MMATATQMEDQRHCRYCNEVVANARPLKELQKKHDKITCSKCQAERKREAFYNRLGYTPEEKKVLKNPKAPVIKEGYSEHLCSKCGSYRELREYCTKRGVRLIAVCIPCRDTRGQELKKKRHELGLVLPIDQARAQKAAEIFGENYCNKCGSLKTAKTYNTKKGIRNNSVCMECKKVRDREHAKNRTPEKNKQICDKYRFSEKILQRRAAQKEASKIGCHCELVLWSCIDCGIKKCRRASDRKSARCKSCSHKINSIKNIKPPKIKTCKLCNTVFQTKGVSVHCKSCIEYNNHIAVSLSVPSKGSYYSRAKLSGAPYEIVNRKKVYERDKYTCYICSCEVVISDKYAHNRASIDHVVPLSKGGGHTYSNIKTCCVLCNAIKGDRVANSIDQGHPHLQPNGVSVSHAQLQKDITIK